MVGLGIVPDQGLITSSSVGPTWGFHAALHALHIEVACSLQLYFLIGRHVDAMAQCMGQCNDPIKMLATLC